MTEILPSESTIHQDVQRNIRSIEHQYKVRVILAVEASSRAWGFSTEASDYDVRFIYVPTLESYAKLDRAPDVLDSNSKGWSLVSKFPLDMVGFDIRKAMLLARKGNATVYEWLQSPIVYHHEAETHYELLKLLRIGMPIDTYFAHYLGMAKSDLYKRGIETVVSPKRGLYALRCCLAAAYLSKFKTMGAASVDIMLGHFRILPIPEFGTIDVHALWDQLIAARIAGEAAVGYEIESTLVQLIDRVACMKPDAPTYENNEAFERLFLSIVREFGPDET